VVETWSKAEEKFKLPFSHHSVLFPSGLYYFPSAMTGAWTDILHSMGTPKEVTGIFIYLFSEHLLSIPWHSIAMNKLT
jgi:hypothetical protein